MRKRGAIHRKIFSECHHPRVESAAGGAADESMRFFNPGEASTADDRYLKSQATLPDVHSERSNIVEEDEQKLSLSEILIRHQLQTHDTQEADRKSHTYYFKCKKSNKYEADDA